MSLPRLHLSPRTATLLAVAVVGCAAIVVGLILLLSQVHAPIGPISGPDGYVSQVSCGNAFTAPPLTGIFTDIDADTGGPGFFQQMADTACSHAKAPKQAGGGVLAGAGVLAVVGAGVSRLAAAKRAGVHRVGLEPPAPGNTEN
jgi:hypothetical protein